jgi:hypothetical protein
MKADFEVYKTELKKLIEKGVLLKSAMQNEQFPEMVEAHFVNELKLDYKKYAATWPVFSAAYQPWYSQAMELVRLALPSRLTDFISRYETPKGRKEVTQDNYVIEDYLKGIEVITGFEKKVVAGPADAIPQFQLQMDILAAVGTRFESSLFDLKRLLQAELFDAELETAVQLAKGQLFRAAGALCGVVLEKHLEQVRVSRNLKAPKKPMAVSDYITLFKSNEVIGFPEARLLQSLAETRNECLKNKKIEPTPTEIGDMISGVDKVIKTVF